jgi:hypothetical protein
MSNSFIVRSYALRVAVSRLKPNQDSQAYPAELCTAVAELVQLLRAQGARGPLGATGIIKAISSQQRMEEEEEEVALY